MVARCAPVRRWPRRRQQAICTCAGRRTCPLLHAGRCCSSCWTIRPRSAPMRSSWGGHATRRLGIAGQHPLPLLRPADGLDRFRPAGPARSRLAAYAQSWPRFRSQRGQQQGAAGVLQRCRACRMRCRPPVAQLATQRELYGDAAFDTEFSADELSIGTFLALHGTDSILLGAHAGDFFADGKAVRTSAMGRRRSSVCPVSSSMHTTRARWMT